MRILHNISLNFGPPDKKLFSEAGVNVELGLSTFRISEDDARWPKICSLVQRYRAVDVSWTRFTASELDSAKYIALVPTWHHGYPQPEKDFAYRSITYDSSELCESCGTGLRQIAPFRFLRPRIWGKKAVLQLNWVFDEYFVKPDVWGSVFKPLGIGCMPVLLHKSGAVIDSVVQLENKLTVDLHLNGFDFEQCPACGRSKYLPVTRGYHPKPSETDLSIFRSTQYFGSGASANKAVIVSAALYRRIRDTNLKGVDFLACAS